jgi:hypothetical protein
MRGTGENTQPAPLVGVNAPAGSLECLPSRAEERATAPIHRQTTSLSARHCQEDVSAL